MRLTWRAVAVATALLLTAGSTPRLATPVQAASNVTVCHKGNEIQVSQSAVPAHLGHGDTLGACSGGGGSDDGSGGGI